MGRPRSADRRAVVAAVAVTMAAVLSAGCHDSTAGGRPGGDDGGSDGPQRIEKPPSPETECRGTTDAGAPCPGDSCGGVLKSVAALQTGEVAESGPANACPTDKVCVATLPTAAGDGFYLSCVPVFAGAVDFGQPCAVSPGAGPRCADDSLCLPPLDGAPAGAFCASLCRIDDDCPGDAFCLEYKTAALPNKSYALLGMCTPRAKLPVAAAAALCRAEADCPAGQGCRVLGARTTLQVCVPGGAKALGEACAAGSECRSGECLDNGFRFAAAGRRAACSGVCWRNSDCGANQRCVRAPQSDNGTAQDPSDDVVLGYCRTLVVADPAQACAGDNACAAAATGDACDTATGVCFSRAAVIGAACKQDADCPLGATCETGPRFPGGACVASGCQPAAAAGSPDACPAGSVCAQRPSDLPLLRCYEQCAQPSDCHRFADGYRCGVATQPADICLYDKGN